MKTSHLIDRRDPLWRKLFFENWKHLLAKDKTDSAGIVQGPQLAQSAAALADDAMREAMGLGAPPACTFCAGVGCELCHWTGKTTTTTVQAIGEGKNDAIPK